MLQFEPERFADGLLGIGSAGGTSSANEGVFLAARLEGLRKERSERAATLKVADPKKPEAMAAIDIGAIDKAVIQTAPTNPGASKNRKKSKNKKNKRKRGDFD